MQLEHDDALAVLARYDTPETLFYVDPPYVASTRGARWATTAYAHELGDTDHRTLAEALHALQGMVVLSGYPCPLYDNELYPGWRTVDRKSAMQSSRMGTERLWCSPRAWASLATQEALL